MTSTALRIYQPLTLLLVALLQSSLVFSQTAINPLDPFAGLISASDWQNRFRIEAVADPADPFHNLSGAQLWRRTWQGQWKDAAAAGVSFAEFWGNIQGGSGNSYIVRSPYPYVSAEEHWQAWEDAAGGGVQHTRSSVPDWSGDWLGERSTPGVMGGGAQLSDIYEAVSTEYKAYFIQAVQAEIEGRAWWPADTCLPNGLFRDGWRNRFIQTGPELTFFIKDQPLPEVRYIYTDGRGFLPEDWALTQWYGESQGIWDGDELIIWSKNVKGWFGGHGLPEYSDAMQYIERWKKVGDQLLVDITFYDPLAFAYPWHDVAVFSMADDEIENWMQQPPSVNDCVSTNNTYHDELGLINERSPGNPDYHDLFDTRPWASNFERAEAAKQQGLLPAAENFIDIE